jgi:branched-chain amino acid transport system substrate-binding protein
LGFKGVMRPHVSTSCADHMGSHGPVSTPGTARSGTSPADWFEADQQIIKPLVKSTAAKYAADKKLTPRTPADCQS